MLPPGLEHTPMPTWVLVLLVVVILFLFAMFPVILIAAKRGVLTKISLFGLRWLRPSFKVMGSRWIVDKELKGRFDVQLLTDITRAVITELSRPGMINAAKAKQQLGKMVVVAHAALLTSPERKAATGGDENKDGKEDRYTGLTHGPTYLEIAAHEEFWDATGKVEILRTAWTYELLNALLWEQKGPELAAAESFVDPNNRAYLQLVKDADGDGDVDAKDVELLKEERRKYDQALSDAHKLIRSNLLG